MRIAITNFTGGEVATTLSARYDLSRHTSAVRCMENFLPTVHGNVERRSGTRFLADIGSDAILIPFSFSVEREQNFILVLTEKSLRVANHQGFIAHAALSSPWSVSHAAELSFAQVGDVVYFAHNKYPLYKLMRTGTAPNYSWSLQKVSLNTSLSAPGKPSVSFAQSSETDSSGTASADLDYDLRYKIVAVDSNGKESLPSAAGSGKGKHPSDWVIGNNVRLSWSGVSGAVEYNIYREEAGYFGFIGISTSTSFTDNNYQADVADTPREDWDPFANNNHPGVVAFHQQRMILAATPNSPQAFYMSRVGDFENFRKSRPLQDDDPLEYVIASGSIDSITWLASFGDLLIGTSGSEYRASGNGAAITNSNIDITAQSYWGSSNLFPIVIGNSILHVQRHGARVRDLFYSLEKDGYAGNDLSIMSPHLFDGFTLRQWAYQQTPSSTIWMVRNDGMLLALTYMKEHDIWGWSRHITQGKVRSVITISDGEGDALYMVVQREKKSASGEVSTCYYLEKLATPWRENQGMDNAFFVDAGITSTLDTPSFEVAGLEHLEGLPVVALADGSPIEELQVHNGKIDLPYAAQKVHVGLAYTSALSPMARDGESQNGSTLGQVRAYGQCTVRMHASVGGKYGAERENLFDFPFVPAQWGDAILPFTGDLDFIPGGGQKTDASLWIVQDRPLPFTVSALVMDVYIV